MKTMTSKRRPRVGDTLWRVEWCSKLAFYEDSEDIDRDGCTMASKCFLTHDEARAFAEQVWPQTVDKFGIVEVWQIEFMPYDQDDAVSMPHAGFWEATTDEGEIFSGEWE